MKKSSVVFLSALLAVAFIVLWIGYRQYADTQRTVAAYKDRLSAMDDRIDQMHRENRGLRDQVADRAHTIAQLNQAKQRISELENTAAALSGRTASADAMVADLQNQVAAFQKRVSEGSETILQKNADIGRLQNRVSALASEKAAAMAQVRQLTAAHGQTVSELERDVQQKADQIAGLAQELAASGIQAQKLRQEVDSRGAEIAGLRGQVSDLAAEKDAAADRIGQLKAEQEQVVKTLNRQIQDRDQKIGLLDDQLAMETDAGRTVKASLEKAQDTIAALNAQLANVEQGLRASGGQRLQIRSDAETAIAALQEKIAERESRCRALETALEKIKGEAAALLDQVRTAETRIQHLEGQNAALMGEKQQLASRMGQVKATYAAMTSELEKQILKKEVTIKELEGKLSITFVDHILFEFGQAAISSRGKQVLTRVGKALETIRDKTIRVVGHTDNIPIMAAYRYRFPSNWELSAARAAAVVRFLQTRAGVDPRHLEAVGRSLYDPVATNDTEQGRARNRRVSIVVAPRMQ